MTILIAASSRDEAAVNIADKLICYHGFRKTKDTFDGKPVYRYGDAILAFLNTESIFTSDLDERLEIDEVIFASRHQSLTGKPTLCVHVPGNLGDEAVYGGRPREVAWANPLRVRMALRSLYDNREKVPSYSISLEVTHHGPTEMSVPITFVEIGSSQKQWIDEVAGLVVAKAIFTALSGSPRGRPAVGFGGTHYAPTITRAVLEHDIAIGHIIPRYVLENVDVEMVRGILRKNIVPCKCGVLDWKGMKSNTRRLLLEILKGEGIEVVRI